MKIVLLLLFTLASGQSPRHGESERVLQAWSRMETRVQESVFEWIRQRRPQILDILQEVNTSQICTQSLTDLMDGIQRLDTWAVLMLDSSGKPPSGLLSGTATDYGSYDECLSIPRTTGIQTHYCTIEYRPPLPSPPSFQSLNRKLDVFSNITSNDKVFALLAQNAQFAYHLPLRLGLCLPKACSREDVARIAERAGQWYELQAVVPICDSGAMPRVGAGHVVALCAMVTAFVAVGVGTIFDLYVKIQNGKAEEQCINPQYSFQKVLISFSAYTNVKKLLTTKGSHGNLSCMVGLRVFSMMWVILGHTYLLLDYYMLRDVYSIKQMLSGIFSQVVVNATVSVDTFCCVAGFLTAYNSWKHVKVEKKPFNPSLFIFHRWWRLTPPLVFAVCLTVLGPFLTYGPIDKAYTQPFVSACNKNWWATLLYINTFVNSRETCITYTWYVCNDFLFRILSLAVLIPLFRWPRIGLGVNGLFILGSIITTLAITFHFNYPPTMVVGLVNWKDTWTFISDFYSKPYHRLASYCIGIAFGYYMAVHQKTFTLSRFAAMVGWLVTFVFMMSALFGTYYWNRGWEFSTWESAFYSALHRSAWCLGVGWIIVMCATSRGGPINKVLSWKFLVPVDRLTYLAYLFHGHVNMMYLALIRERISPTGMAMFFLFVGNLIGTYVIAFAFSLVFESPFIRLEKVMFGSSDREKRVSTDMEASNLKPYPETTASQM